MAFTAGRSEALLTQQTGTANEVRISQPWRIPYVLTICGSVVFLVVTYAGRRSSSVHADLSDSAQQVLASGAVAPRVKAVVWDMGGVWAPDTDWWEILPEVPLEKRPAVDRARKQSWDNASVAPVYNMEQFWTPILDAGGLGGPWEDYNQRARDSFVVYWEVLGVIDSVKKHGYRVGIISNHIHDWFWYVFRKYGLFDLWIETPLVVVSSDVESKKPGEDIFRSFLKGAGGLRPEECIFVDNTQANLDTAARLGFRTVLFHYKREGCGRIGCIEGLYKDLRALGLYYI